MDDRELELFFSSLSEEEAEMFLKDIKVEEDPKLSERIKNNLQLESKGRIIKFPIKKAVGLIAAVSAVTICAALGVRIYDANKPVPTTTTAVTATKSQSLFSTDMLKIAINSGDEGLIEKILAVAPSIFSDEIINLAIDCVEYISYGTLHNIVTTVVEYRGTTGLDPLLESTLLGDTEKALEELEKRGEVLTSYAERLAFFFAAAFCDSEVLNSFLEKGFSPDLTDIHGNNIYEIAQKYGNEDNIQYLNSKGV
ncbi:MAG: hypothetical protein ACI4GC_02990 [Acutalibacteraceae bacterium]